MFSLEMLHRIRQDEIARLAAGLAPGSRVLEIGAGTGFQARMLSAMGFAVSAVDLPRSDYSEARLVEITDYDGRTLPFPDASFDAVLSSNVLEHVHDLAALQAEIIRVLAPGGVCVHAMPSASWRFWTIIAGYLDLLPFVARQIAALLTGAPAQDFAPTPRGRAAVFLRGLAARLVPPAHGELGSALGELMSFGRRAWIGRFEAQGFEVLQAEPMGLFYTGILLLGRAWPMAERRRAARLLGSACILYRVRPVRPPVKP